MGTRHVKQRAHRSDAGRPGAVLSGAGQRSAPADPAELRPDREGVLFAFLQALVAMLVAARMLVPPEAAVEGSTLWLVELWFVAGLIWAWDAWRRADSRLRLDLCDLAVWVIVAGHVASALWTLHIGGDRRAALNLMWEWVGLGTSFLLLRQVLRRATDARRLLVAMLCLAAALAGLGIWQYHVGLPEARREYEAIITELETIQRGAPEVTAAEALARRNRQLELQQKLAERQVPADPQGRRLFEDRLRSTEPFGLFALANTFAALLLAWLTVAAALELRSWMGGDAGERRALRMAFGIVLVALFSYGLVLTKSRTAWVGLALGVLVWAWLERRASRIRAASPGRSEENAADRAEQPPPRTTARTAIGVFGLLAAATVFVAALSGGLDRQVVSESPKSFRYRLQYWVGAAGVVRQHPVFGVGPGNFRQHYLRYKLPASSEEIAEPHNWVLDLWVNGGLLAIGGAILLIVVGGRKLARAQADLESGALKERDSGGRWLAHPLVWGTGGACLIVLAGPMLVLVAQVDQRLIGLSVGWLLLVVLAGLAYGRGAPLPIPAIAAACAGVLVHLLGSGGIEMPAIPQMLLLLLALGTAPGIEAWGRRRANAPLVRMGVMTGMAVLCALCWRTAAGPVFEREALVAQGDAYRIGDPANGLRQNPQRAAQLYAQAAESDPLSAEPLVRLADLAVARGDFETAVRYARLAIAADPHSPALYRLLGHIYLTRFGQRSDVPLAESAAEALREAVLRYPSSARLQAEAALASDAAGNAVAARQHAERALEIDEISRREGHLDKYLPDSLRMEVQRLSRVE
jgi:hypothetical protein